MTSDLEPFRIYSASAGSGKTYTLTREYLRLLLGGRGGQPFREILAITFTNKAVGELKNRILDSLEAFAATRTDQERPSLFRDLQADLGTDRETLARRSARVLQEILHNYAFFDVSTIDKFNHRILRTFSRDLQLPAGFEVVLDSDALLERAVDNLIMQAGEAPELTRVLIDFALEKSADDRSWDIGRDLAETGKLLFNENHAAYLKTFDGKGISDFLRLREKLAGGQAACKARLLELTAEILAEIEGNGLETTDFHAGYFPKFIQKIHDGDFDQDFDAAWKRDFADRPLYSKSNKEAPREILDRLHPAFIGKFEEIRTLVLHRAFLKNAYTNCAPFTVLGLLQLELKRIEQAESLLPVAKFNSIISEELADQPAPYIYERLGEKYRHYFIDEFQDTSELQWKNLVPLIGNALEGEDEQGQRGSLVLVGDAKQAIYRWRGGYAEQFLGLIRGPGNPFSVQAKGYELPVNYRSCETIVRFNNDFFSELSQKLSNPDYERLFRDGNRQLPNSRDPGLVEIGFLHADPPDREAAYLDRTVEILARLRQAGYAYGSVCVLTRRRRDGVVLSERLLAEGIPVISSETLLLKNHPAVAFLIDLLHFLEEPEDRNHRFGILSFLAPDGVETHSWIHRHLEDTGRLLRQEWSFFASEMALKPAYDILETAIRQFRLGEESEAYLFALLEYALEAARHGDVSLGTFLEYWESKKDKLSIAAPESPDALRLMTIHSAKGLEFPVVIFPFADSSIYAEKNPKLWVPVDPGTYCGFSYLQINSRREVEAYGEMEAALYREERGKLELDAYNVLYVAHTRAVEALFVLTGPMTEKEVAEPRRYTDLYRQYLKHLGKWDGNTTTYSFGRLGQGRAVAETAGRDPLAFAYSSRESAQLHIVTQSGRLWDSPLETAKKYGNTLHLALSMIRTAGDLPGVVPRLIGEGLVPDGQRGPLENTLRQIVGHPELSPYFREGPEIYNERGIILRNKVILRPDRLVVDGGSAVVIDYKTALPAASHRDQVQAYAGAVSEMGLRLERALLVYISDNGIKIETL
ncbi:exodeoxyribonuclease V subunit beta [Robiginitalea sp. SC105]|uniref:UvrD-helicase domain-containing protein n=1 Tax=Robiginitalea sp. SC105 TaxID=2762332 RepID=UPI001639C7B9|nr:UvrD-helicase domain-containing protein [Robiginitalea sp. SC105]MBC2838070.1 UvrD-helicase domain-containing protein [Robiginitalea sp. SC105]